MADNRIIEKEKVLEIVAGRISLNWMYTAPPEVKMLPDGSIKIDNEANDKLD